MNVSINQLFNFSNDDIFYIITTVFDCDDIIIQQLPLVCFHRSSSVNELIKHLNRPEISPKLTVYSFIILLTDAKKRACR